MARRWNGLDFSSNASLRQCLVDALAAQMSTGPSYDSAGSHDGQADVCP